MLVEKIVSFIDLTNLHETDEVATIAALCHQAQGPKGQVAAVCVRPRLVKQAVAALSRIGVKVATVANFPHGTESLESVIESIAASCKNGAQEIDVVFPYPRYLALEKQFASDFISACKQACGKDILLKVILETGVLKEKALIAEVSQNAILAGADFLKTSTGRVVVGATVEAAAIMLQVIKNISTTLNRPVGFKASGGIRTSEQALQYIQLAEKMLGPEWVTPEHFRIGASQLLS